jgi:hypothetical protein
MRDADADAGAIDRKLVELAAKKGELDEEIGRWLLAAERANVHRELGFASLVEYAERRLGYDARTTKEKLRVATALEELPGLRDLLRSGARSWSAVREIVRVASPEQEQAWIERTQGMTVRQVEALVAGHDYGDAPTDPKDPVLTPRRMVFELAPETFALVNAAFEQMRREIGPAASNDEALRAMAETILGKRRVEEEAGYQISLTICASCDRTWQHTGSQAIEVPDSVGARGLCDGELVGATRIEQTPTPVGQEVAVPRSTLDAFMRAASEVFSGPRASLTPLRRKFILARDQRRCSVPGCANHRFLEIHHLHARAQGGGHDVSNGTALCNRHHELYHAGYLAIEGMPESGLRFTDARGTLYGAARSTADPS